VLGLSENIEVRSILGQFLEHSRIFRFGSPQRGLRYFIGSADLMTRNLDQRVEALAPIEEPALQERLENILQAALADDAQAWILDQEGRWMRREPRTGFSSQRKLQELALARAR
jgi:polyphosphate kinase